MTFFIAWYNVAMDEMTPIPIEVKEYLRQFFKKRMDYEKANTANTATGFVIHEIFIEKFLDEMWVFINKKKQEQSNEKPIVA